MTPANAKDSPARTIRLIVADLDGTLLTPAHTISAGTDAAVRAAINRGVLFTVATGKTFPSTREISARFGISIPVICGNGTQVFMPDGTSLFEDALPLETARQAVRLAREAEMVPVIYTRQGLLVDTVDDRHIEVLVAHHEPVPEVVDDLIQALGTSHHAVKMVLMHHDPVRVAHFKDRIGEVLAGQVQALWSGLDVLFELMPHGINKGTALRHLLRHLSLSAEETMTLGDNCNDVAMIQQAGIGVAMANAPADVRAAADYVTTSNDNDGVGHAIQRFVLDGDSHAHPAQSANRRD